MKKLYVSIVFVFIAFVSRAQNRTYDTLPYVPDYYAKRLALFKSEPIVENKIIFIGNSITQFGNWKKLLNDSSVINRGIAGDITFGVLNRLDETIARKPAKLFIKIGINDISKNIPDQVIVENILSIVRKVKTNSPRTQVFVQSVLPTNQKAKEEYPDAVGKNDHVVNVNTLLMKHAKRNGYTFVDLYAIFHDDDGNLNAGYAVDGIHLTEVAYQRWIELLKDKKYL